MTFQKRYTIFVPNCTQLFSNVTKGKIEFQMSQSVKWNKIQKDLEWSRME